MNALLKQAKKKRTTSTPKSVSKSSVPVIGAPEEVAEAVAKVRSAITAKKKAEADLASYGDQVIDFFLEYKEEQARQLNFHKSFKINGDGGEQIKIVQSNKSLKINPNDIDTLQNILTETEFEMLLEETSKISVKPEVLEPDSDLGTKLMGFLGETEEEQSENFSLFFESTVGLKIKTDFDRNIFRLEEGTYNSLGVYVKLIRPGII